MESCELRDKLGIDPAFEELNNICEDYAELIDAGKSDLVAKAFRKRAKELRKDD